MKQGVRHPLDEELVYLRLLPAEFEPNLLAALAREVAYDEPHALEDFADLHHTHAHHAFAQVSQLARHREARLLQRAPLGGCDRPLQTLQALFQPRAARDQLAYEAHQLVQTREVYAHEVGGREHRRGARLRGRAQVFVRVESRGRFFYRAVSQVVFVPARERRLFGGCGDDELEDDAALRPDVRRGSQNLSDLLQARADAVDVDAALRERGRRDELKPPDARVLRAACGDGWLGRTPLGLRVRGARVSGS